MSSLQKNDFHRLPKVKQVADRRERSDKNKDIKQRKKLREPLYFGELIYVLAERLKKKDASGKFYQSFTENQPFFNKNQLFTIRKRVIFNNGSYNCWLSKRKHNRQKIHKTKIVGFTLSIYFNERKNFNLKKFSSLKHFRPKNIFNPKKKKKLDRKNFSTPKKNSI